MDITSYNDKNLNIKNFKGIRPCTDKSLTSSIKLSQYYVQKIIDKLNARIPILIKPLE